METSAQQHYEGSGTNNSSNPTNINLQEAILKRLKAVEDKLIELNLNQKLVLNFAEAQVYLQLSESHLYKLTCKRGIPYYKPYGKKLYFDRVELDKWRLTNPIKTLEQIESAATSFKGLRKVG